MEKREFFSKLELELSKKYNISDSHIRIIRSLYIGYKKSRKDIAEFAAVKLPQPTHHPGQSRTGRRSHNKEYYQTLLNFTASCSTEAWNDITQITRFDKNGERKEG